MNKHFAGVDLGGTNILVVLKDDKNQTKAELNLPTEADKGPTYILEKIISMVLMLLKKNNISQKQLYGIGVGVPGLVDSYQGVSVFSPNLKGWSNIPVRDSISRGLGVPVHIDNDVRMAAWGEKKFGAGRNREDVICLTLGTGIGAGIFINNKMLLGHKQSAGEVGHMTIETNGLLCSCGNYGCFEMYASGRGIARLAQDYLKDKNDSLMLQLVEGKISGVTAGIVSEAALKGDALAKEIILETATYLGIGLANIANAFNPQRIVLGGGVMKGGGLLLEPTIAVVNKRAMLLNREVEIVPAELGDKAGAIGAATTAKMNFIMEE